MSEAGYHPTSDQLATAGALDEALADLLQLPRLHESGEESATTWDALDQLGTFIIAAPEAKGGVGLGIVEEVLITQSLGRGLAHPSVIATIGAAHGWLAEGETVPSPTPRVAAGYDHNGRTVAVDDAAAEMLLVRGASGAKLVAHKRGNSQIDNRNWLATLTEAEQGETLATYTARDLLRLRLLDAAALAGVAQTGLNMAVAYAQMRVQFGRPIGTFQAIKHHCADMAIAARTARDQVNFAAVALEQGRAEAEMQVECALVVAGNAAIKNAGVNIQIHGGIGFSEEADPHLVLKRAQLYATIAGGLEAATERLGNIPANL